MTAEWLVAGSTAGVFLVTAALAFYTVCYDVSRAGSGSPRNS